MGSVRTILASLFTALGGFFLLAMTAGAGFALYLATAPDSVSSPAKAEAISSPPLVRAQFVPAGYVMHVAAASLPGSVAVSMAESDHAARIRQLQKALASAACYNGPISGIWSNASKDAMRGFVQTVNAELPVETPDETLVALIESNDTTTCAPGRAIETGSLGAKSAAPLSPSDGGDDASGAPPSLLGRAWAPAAMLVPTKDASTESAEIATSAATQITASNELSSNDVSPTEPASTSGTSSTAHFEGSGPLPAAQPADPEPAAAESAPKPSKSASAKPKKSKIAQRRPAKYENVETTISNGFDTLQRSISSMF